MCLSPGLAKAWKARMLQKLHYLWKEMGVTKNGAWYCLQDTPGDCVGHFPLRCSGKCRCGASIKQTLPGCTDDSTECQNHLYGRVIQGWLTITIRGRLSRERTRTVSASQIASEKMSLIHTELWPPQVPIMPWSLETGSCLAWLNGGGLKYFRNYRPAHKAWTNNFIQGRFGQGLQLPASRNTLTCWRDAARAPLLT